MAYFLIGSGILLWIILLVNLLQRFFNLRAIRKITMAPVLYPLTRFIGGKYMTLRLALLGKLRLRPPVSASVLKGLNSVKYEHLAALRDALKKVDALPTIEKGKKALGIKSVFDLNTKPQYMIQSEYSHPLQRPMFYLPGVPAIPFYDNYSEDHEWARPLEEAFPIIREELLALMEKQGMGFQKYLAEDDQIIRGWNTFNFFFFGKKFEENCVLCPKTTAILESLPRFEKDHIMFSALNPHAHIPLHYGPMNGILRVHLPLIVPDGCYLRVGPEERKVEEGKLMVFDDAFWHEAVNHTDHLRVVLFLNFWHPCFSEEEIDVLEEFRRAYELHPMAQQHAKGQELQRDNNMAIESLVAD